MAIKPSGPISLGTDLPAEFGGSAPFSLSQYYRGGGRVPQAPQNANIPTEGAISLGDFYNAVNVLPLTISGTVVNYNLYNEFVAKYGAPSGGVPVRLDITAGSVVGGSGTAALNVGQFPAGTVIEIYNNGSIQGFGGGANSGGGGDAVYAAYGGQTMRFFNQAGASCYGGGGGGGHGGNGGSGGGGTYTEDVVKGAGGCLFVMKADQCRVPSCQNAFGPSAVCGGSCVVCDQDPFVQKCSSCYVPETRYTNGGGGGGGGNGGGGQGFNQGRGGGDPGAGGSAGGTNAGAGGQGGHGGAGGDWGQNGYGGDTGATGANGNNGSGQGGTPGAGGGAAGRYLVKGGADFTFINNGGATAGGVA